MKPVFVDEVPGPNLKVYSAPEPEWAAALMARPREWAIVEHFGWDKTKANSMQQRISRGYWKWQENHKGSWESRYREATNGYDVYARYIPE